uniref:Uncharacterized protein n=1 Tax=Cacopsylla melanoneura TaxID=428564 RepID=A0A8D8UMB6_9HEMI
MQREQRDLFIQESEHTRQDERDLFNQESEHIRQDERDVDKQLRQSDLCSGLDRQVAEQLGVQEKARENSKHCNKKWMSGGDSAQSEVDDAADTLKKGRECDEYNRATVREHETCEKPILLRNKLMDVSLAHLQRLGTSTTDMNVDSHALVSAAECPQKSH